MSWSGIFYTNQLKKTLQRTNIRGDITTKRGSLC